MWHWQWHTGELQGGRGLSLPDLEFVFHCELDAGLVETIGHVYFVLDRIEQLSGCHTIDQVNGGAFSLGHGCLSIPLAQNATPNQ